MTDRSSLVFGEADGRAFPEKRREDLLREEAEASSLSRRARILHELGETFEGSGNLNGAVKEYEAAHEASPAFAESVEGLWRLIERRRALGDASQVASALLECATTNEERARALLLQASLLEQSGDLAGATTKAKDAVFEDAARVSPSGWLALEILGAKTADRELQRTALESRAEAALDPHWQGLLLLDVAERAAQAKDTERATELLLQVLALEGGPRFGAALALERLALGGAADSLDFESLARALETQGSLLDDAHADAEKARALGVPRFRRSAAHRTEVWLRAAFAREQLQDWPATVAALERAMAAATELLPDDAVHTVIARSRLRAARATDDEQTALEVSQGHLASEEPKPLSTTFALEYAAHAAKSGEEAAAFEALGFALGQDVLSIPARAFQYDWLAQDPTTPRLAVALDALAAQALSAEAKTRLRTLSAILWITRGHDVSAAEKALAQAALPAEASARLGRALARVAGDSAWYERAATELLVALGNDAHEESVSVLFELVALQIRSGNREHAQKTLERMQLLPEGRTLAMVVRAHLPETPDRTRRELFEQLRDGDGAGDLVRIFASAAAFTDRLGPQRSENTFADTTAEDRTRTARELETLARTEPQDLVLCIAAASMLTQIDAPIDAAALLEATAAAIEDPLVVASLRLEAGFLRFRTSSITDALASFQAAEDTFAESTKTVMPWAKRALGVADTEARREAIDIELAQKEPDEAALSFERFALELRDGNTDEALAFLGKAEAHATDYLAPAAALLRLTWPRASADTTASETATALLVESGDQAKDWVLADRARRAREEGAPEWIAAARSWYEASPTVGAALEWLAAADRDPTEREAALRAMADVLPPAEQEALLAAAALIGVQGDDDARDQMPLLAGEGAPSRLANLELSPPGCDTSRRLHALSEIGDALNEDAEVEACALAGWSALASGQPQLALELFGYVTTSQADHLAAWEGQRAAAEALGNAEARALAAEQLGARAGDAEQAALFWEEAATHWFMLGDTREARGEAALEASVERDPACTPSFERLFRRVRERKAHERLLALIDVRLPVIVSETEREKLTWERARALRELAKFDAAMEALDAVRALNPDHVGALALSGEIFIRRGQFEEAAEILAYLATVEDAPARNRITAGVTAVDLFENKLGQATRALEVLVSLDEAELTTLPVRERLAKVAAKVGDWDRAAEILERLMEERPTPEGQTEAARLAMVIHRDRRKAAYDATDAVLKVLAAEPGDEEALDLLLLVDIEPSRKQSLLTKGRDALRDALEKRIPDQGTLRLFAELGHALHDDAQEHAALSAASAFGDPQAHDLAAAAYANCPSRPSGTLGESERAALLAPQDDGALARLFVHLASTLSEAFGPNLQSLGVGRRERVDAKSANPIREEVAAWAKAFGIGEFELYIGGKDTTGIQGIAGSPPAFVIGTGVRSPFEANQRARIAMEMWGVLRGTSVLRFRDNATVSAIVVASANLAKVPVQSPGYAVQAEVDKLVSKAVGRKIKAALPELVAPLSGKSPDASAWIARALLSQARVGLLACGSLAVALEEGLSVVGGRSADSLAHDRRALELLRFHLSRSYSDLRQLLRLEGAS